MFQRGIINPHLFTSICFQFGPTQPQSRPYFSSRFAFFFVAILNSYEETAVLNVQCCDTDPIVAQNVATKFEKIRLNSLRDELSKWRRKKQP